jgi:formylglycine-generating enzyme required for sulfatase activity/tetratricopeptide (TPR) repeat protein
MSDDFEIDLDDIGKGDGAEGVAPNEELESAGGADATMMEPGADATMMEPAGDDGGDGDSDDDSGGDGEDEIEATMMEKAPITESDDPLIDMVLGNCRLLSKLGEGGMGAVYKGHHEGLDIDVAMKILPKHLADKNPDFIDRFRREARVAARLNHPNVVNVMNVGEEEGVHFIIMEFVKGIDLKEFIVKKGSLELAEAIDLIKQVFMALEAGHIAGILHRDIKPANVFLKEDVPGGVPQAKLGDFGLAKIGESGTNADQGNTMSGMMMGTPHYISPEQAEDAKRVDGRADIYSMGCMLYYMLAGKVPYDGESFVQIVLQHLQSPIPDIREARQGIPDELALAIMKMMAKGKDDRFQTSTDVLKVLNRIEMSLDGGPSMSEAELATIAPVAAPSPAASTMTAGPGQVICPACSQVTGVEGKWCENCGASMLEECRKCKDEVRLGRKFCPSCGYNQDESREIFNRIESAQKYIEEKRFAEALADAEAILALENDAPEALTFKETAEASLTEANGYKENAREAFHLRDYEGIEEFLQHALEITPHDEELKQELDTLPDRIRERELSEYLDIGRDALANRQPREALAAFQKALEYDDVNEEAHIGIKNCEDTIIRIAETKASIESIPEEDLQEVCDTWKRVLGLDTTDEDAQQYHGVLSERLNTVNEHVSRAADLRRNKKWEDSIIEWQSALELWASSPEGTVGLEVTEKLQEADSLLAEKRLPQVLELAQAASGTDPDCEDAIKLRDETQDTLDRIEAWKDRVDGTEDPDEFDTAVSLLDQSLEIHPHDEELQTRLDDFKERVRVRDYNRYLEEGKTAWESYLPRQAFQAFNNALDLEPESEDAKAGRDECQAVINDVEQMTSQAEQHEEKGELDLAIAILEKIIEKDPESQQAPKAHEALNDRMEKAKALIEGANDETETRDWGKALTKWEECLMYWGAYESALEGKKTAGRLLEEFEAQYAISKGLHSQKKITTALVEHEKALEIGISDEALMLNDEMMAAHKQAKALSEAGSGAVEESLWREAAGKLEAAYALNIESVEENQLHQAQTQCRKVEEAIEKSSVLLKDGHFFKAEDEARIGLALGKDLKLEEIQEKAKAHADEVREAIKVATEEEKTNPPKAVNLWHRVLELQPVNESAPGKVLQIEKTINIAQQNFERGQTLVRQKKWAAAIDAGNEAKELNPVIPGIDEFLQQTAGSFKKQKIVIVVAIAAVLAIIAFVVVKSYISAKNKANFENLMTAGATGLTSGDWATAEESFTSAKVVFPGSDKETEADTLSTIASRLAKVDAQLKKAKQAAGSKNWQVAAAAYSAARKQLGPPGDLTPAQKHIGDWLKKWTRAEYETTLAYSDTLDTKAKVEIWSNFLKDHKVSEFDKDIRARNKTLLVTYYTNEYNTLSDEFYKILIDDALSATDVQIKGKAAITRLETLLTEASGTKFPIPPHLEVKILTKELKNAPFVREIKKAVEAAKTQVKSATTAAAKVAVWTEFGKKYPGKELATISGELEKGYNSIIQQFETKLADNSFADAARLQQAAKTFDQERRSAKFTINIATGNDPDGLSKKLAERKSEVKKAAFTRAEDDAKDKAPAEQITIWNTFLEKYPKDVYGNHTKAAEKYSYDAHVADYTANYKMHVTVFTAKLKVEDFTASDAALKKAETLFNEAKTGGYALDLPAEESPVTLRQSWTSTKNSFDLKEDYDAAKAKAVEQKAQLDIATVWEAFVKKHPLSNQAKEAKAAITTAYKTAYNEQLAAFNTALGKKSEAGYNEAGTPLTSMSSTLKRATDGGYNFGLTTAQQPDILTKKLTEERSAWVEETTFNVATADADKQFKAHKFDDALKTWGGFIAKYPKSRYTDKANVALKATSTAAAEWHVGEGEKAFVGKKYGDALKKAEAAIGYEKTDATAIALKKKIMPRLVAAAGIFEVPTGNDLWGKPVRAGGDDATGFPLEIRHKVTGMHFVFAAAGQFKTEKGASHTISKPLYIGKYEVTRAQVAAFDKATGFLAKAIVKKQKDSDEALSALGQPTVKVNAWNSPGYPQDDTHPAVRITWNDTREYFKWMNKGYSQQLFKLPSEAQWEYTARAGTTTTYFWGDDDKLYTDYATAHSRKTAPAGSKKPNPWGIYDTTGNAMEWCEDWYDDAYAKGQLNAAAGKTKANAKPARGGAYSDRVKKLMISVRSGYTPDYDLRMGFRAVADATTILNTTAVFAAGGR